MRDEAAESRPPEPRIGPPMGPRGGPGGGPGGGVTLYKAGMFESLKIRDYRFLWVSNLTASFAMQMQMVARGWLIYDMTSSPLSLTWVMLSFMLPSFIFSLGGGLLADRLHKKWIMITSQILNMCATTLLAYIIFTEQITFWDFIYFGLFNGTVLSISMPARSSVIPEVVGQEHLVNAMALQSATFNLSRILGPTLAGMLIAVLAHGDTSATREVGIVFFVVAGLYLVSVCCITMLNYVGAPLEREKTTLMEDLAEGFRYMRDEKLILGLLIMGFVPMTFGWSASFLMPAFNKDVIGGGPDDLGLLMTAMGAGALCGSLILARIGDVGGKGKILFRVSYCWAVGLAVFSFSQNLFMGMAFGAVVGLFSSLFGAMNMSVVQMAIRPEIRGRVMSIMMMAQGLMPMGVIPVSAIAEYVGISAALLFSAFMLLISMLWLGWWLPILRQIDKGHGDSILVAR